MGGFGYETPNLNLIKSVCLFKVRSSIVSQEVALSSLIFYFCIPFYVGSGAQSGSGTGTGLHAGSGSAKAKSFNPGFDSIIPLILALSASRVTVADSDSIQDQYHADELGLQLYL